MATSFNVPSSPNRSIISISEFLGVDFTNSSSVVSSSRSPNGQNMIRDVPGKVRKCMGYELISEHDGRINGAHFKHGDEHYIIHSGEKLYMDGEVIYTEMNDERSKSWQLGDNLYIIDGQNLIVYDGETVSKVSESAYIPLVTIGKAPSGGGTSYESLNLLQPGFTEMFLGTEEDVDYQLSFDGLDDTLVEIEVMQEDGSFSEIEEDTDFSVNRETGLITFVEAPGESPVSGQDNIKITAYRTVEGYADRINKCTIGILFGVNGATDRMFISGNPDYINYDWYSDYNNPSYWPDLGYSVLGSPKSAIMGYSIINDYLATHKDDLEIDRNVILREGTLVDNEPSFKIVNSLQGAGAVAKYSFGYLATEPLFLSSLGIYAITPQDISGEKYSQNRSFFLDGKLLKEENLSDAYACVYKDLYFLCLNNVAYILDGLQSVQTDKNKPYSTRQYVGFYRINLPARVMFIHENDLYFGSDAGNVYRFYNDTESPLSYNDNGEPIHAIWETPDFSGSLFYKNKTFRYMAVRLASAIATSITISAFKRGIWSFIKTESRKTRYFSFENIVFSKFTFNNDSTPRTVPTKIKVKKVDKARFKLENNELNEPFGLLDLSFEYIESGNYKG